MNFRNVAAYVGITAAGVAAIAGAIYLAQLPTPVMFDLKPGTRYAVAPYKGGSQSIRAEAFGLNPKPSLYDLGYWRGMRSGGSYRGDWFREGPDAVFRVCHLWPFSRDCRDVAVIKDRFYDDVCAGYVDAKTFRLSPRSRNFAAEAAAHCNNPSPCGDPAMPQSWSQCQAYRQNGGWSG